MPSLSWGVKRDRSVREKVYWVNEKVGYEKAGVDIYVCEIDGIRTKASGDLYVSC